MRVWEAGPEWGRGDRCREAEPLYLSERLSKLKALGEWGRQGCLCKLSDK